MRNVPHLAVAALVLLPLSSPARAQHTAGHPAGHVTNNNAAMAQQQRAMEAQLKQQQRAMEAQLKSEQKAMMQQQKAIQQQAAHQQKAMQQQQHAMQQAAAHEQKAMALQQTKAGPSNAGAPNAAHHTAASKTAHHSTHVTPTVHHPITHWRTWPVSTSASYRHLESLKRHLDGIAMKAVPTTTQKVNLRHALVNVIENSPHPASSHMQTFANHLADSIASRTTPTVDTRALALQLRVMVNNVHMTPVDLDETLTQHQAPMLGARASHPDRVGVLSDDLRYLVAETQTKVMTR